MRALHSKPQRVQIILQTNATSKRNSPIRTVQTLLGHKDVATTMIYPHVMQKPGLGVKSPLDAV
jgi:integrase